MKKCPSCGKEYGDEVCFCSLCGEKLRNATSAEPAKKEPGPASEKNDAPANSPKQDLRLCPQCGAKLEKDSVFCLKCGERVASGGKAPSQELRLCQNCGAKLPKDAAFCEKCGAPGGAAQTAASKKPANSRALLIAGVGAALVLAAILCVVLVHKKGGDSDAPGAAAVTASAPADMGKDFSGMNVGDAIEFGKYQDADIEWQVLDKKDGKLLIISKEVLGFQQYNSSFSNVTWEGSSLRTWLNDDFYNAAFSASEKQSIQETHVINNHNPDEGTDGGQDTYDKVFLLSIDEAKTYFNSDDARYCYMTPYAKSQLSKPASTWPGDDFDGYLEENGGKVFWWLRSPGFDPRVASVVQDNGEIDTFASDIGDVTCYNAVRPAMWIKI